MKRVLLTVLATLSVAILLPATALADPSHPSSEWTVVSGQIKDSKGPVKGATVTVSCNGHSKTTYSIWNGYYATYFKYSQCSDGDTVTVTAVTSKGLSGTSTGTVREGKCDLDLALVNVTVGLPEMGAFTGSAAALAAGGAFFVTRRRKLAQE